MTRACDALARDSDRYRLSAPRGIHGVRAREAEARTWMFDGDGAIPREPLYGVKDLNPGIIRQLGGESIHRAGAEQSESLADGRFNRVCLLHTVLPFKAVECHCQCETSSLEVFTDL
ncbi:MAG TPA: hypothetical protein VJU54_08000 [Nitrospiraceae bacterium]|nr:hypothetical protein [Nitrospiraceae bacterium]